MVCIGLQKKIDKNLIGEYIISWMTSGVLNWGQQLSLPIDVRWESCIGVINPLSVVIFLPELYRTDVGCYEDGTSKEWVEGSREESWHHSLHH